MSNVTISTIGQINNAGDDRALMLKGFSGDLLISFRNALQFMPYVRVKELGPGKKSYQFPAIGQATASRHVRGEDVFDASNSYLDNVPHAERIIHYDRPMVSATAVDDFEEFVNHYDVRATYAEEMGQALGEKCEQDLLRVAILASRASATVTGGPTSSPETSFPATPTAGDIVDLCFDAAKQFDENNVPKMDRVVAITPEWYYTVIKGAPDNVQTTGGTAEVAHPGLRELGDVGNVSVADGFIRRIAGIRLLPTNLLPNIDESATGTNLAASDTGAYNSYYADYSTTAAVFWQKSAVGHIHGKGVGVQLEDTVRTMSTNLVSSYIKGTGILRPECAIEVNTAASIP